ncbi:uncharacterized protein EURHEDRAFT_83358 [Aspergillus ruber CBS 135680]|uniref:Uncharacterized protein n=1 Tax=Aspergillus ruber (strain CBS 135680) TaxID=1388766 RepID=A0A017SDI6_ASPRC|nr:uncharacterized protein EURHEDRAFT_83358 [Aspergillus ruber CBS 135680]EYE94699.1 hypothetical protein EURHEDRAFT_83358 [Aspergillus ruber CBS 135680]
MRQLIRRSRASNNRAESQRGGKFGIPRFSLTPNGNFCFFDRSRSLFLFLFPIPYFLSVLICRRSMHRCGKEERKKATIENIRGKEKKKKAPNHLKLDGLENHILSVVSQHHWRYIM